MSEIARLWPSGLCQHFSFRPIFGGITYPPSVRYGLRGLLVRSFFRLTSWKCPFRQNYLQLTDNPAHPLNVPIGHLMGLEWPMSADKSRLKWNTSSMARPGSLPNLAAMSFTQPSCSTAAATSSRVNSISFILSVQSFRVGFLFLLQEVIKELLRCIVIDSQAVVLAEGRESLTMFWRSLYELQAWDLAIVELLLQFIYCQFHISYFSAMLDFILNLPNYLLRAKSKIPWQFSRVYIKRDFLCLTILRHTRFHFYDVLTILDRITFKQILDTIDCLPWWKAVIRNCPFGLGMTHRNVYQSSRLWHHNSERSVWC